MKCSYKRCRSVGDYIAVADRKDGTYSLCEKHWLSVAKLDGSIQTNLTKVAIPFKHSKQGD